MDTVIDYRYKFSNQKWSETKRMAFDMDEALWEDIDNLDFFIHEGLLSPYKITIKHVGIESSVLFNIQFTKIFIQKEKFFITYLITQVKPYIKEYKC